MTSLDPSTPNASADKVTWRHWADGRARPLDDETNEAIVHHLEAWLRPHASLLVFSSMPGEPDLSGLQHRGSIFLTRTPDSGPLTIHSAESPRELHRWGYSQPAAGTAEIAPETIDVVLVPGAVFGEDGSRVGHGKGYYDRLLATMRPGVERVGVAAAALVVPSLPMEAHDVPMTHLATEAGVRFVGSGPSKERSAPSSESEQRNHGQTDAERA